MGIGIGLVGLGAFGSEFAELFRSHPLVDRVALCDREPERVRKFAERESFREKFHGSDACDSFDEVLEADLDAVAIITQPWLHAEQAVRAMEAGLNVYSAVPVVMLPDGAEILEWCDRIVETSRRTGRLYMLGETTWYRPETMYCRRRASEGAFGDFVYAEGEYFHDVDLPTCSLREVREHRTSSASGREWLEREREYFERGARGGPMHYPTHSVSGPLSVMDTRYEKVSAFGFPAPEGDEFFARDAFADETALFYAANGATVRIAEFRLAGLPGRELFNVVGTKGSFYGAEGQWGESRWMTREGAEEVPLEKMRDPLPDEVLSAFREATGEDPLGGHGGSHAYLVHEFLDAVAAERQPAINAATAAHLMAAGVLAHRSALAGGELLDVPD